MAYYYELTLKNVCIKWEAHPQKNIGHIHKIVTII